MEDLMKRKIDSEATFNALVEFIFEKEVAPMREASKEQAREKLPEEMFSEKGHFADVFASYVSPEGKAIFEKYFSEGKDDAFYEGLMDVVRAGKKQKEKQESDTPRRHILIRKEALIDLRAVLLMQ
jgi:hypothetical protein